MYSVLIVDDEDVIRRGLKIALPWEEHGFTVVGAVSGSVEALQHLERSPVDVLITDIRMPRVSGLELGRVVCERYPQTKIVILSGYSSFAYAREAIQYRVFGYLLKPSKEAEIVELLGRLRTVLDDERRARRHEGHSPEVLDRTSGLDDEGSGRKVSRTVREATALVDRDYASGISLQTLSRELAVSAAHLCRIFRRELGCSFKEYLRDVRMVKAKELLGGSHLKVYEVARKVGYDDPRYFSETFKERTGLTPLEYRNRASP